MPFAIPIAIAASSGLGLVGAAKKAGAANKAGDLQYQAATHAADLEKQAADEALQFNKDVYANDQKNIAPWLQAGTGAIGQLSQMTGPGGSLTTPWQGSFQAPTGATEQNDPGYQFRLSEGMKALEHSASARGGLLSGGTAKALTRYGQDYASNEYGNVYNRAMGEYQNKFNEFQIGQNNTFNRLASVAGTGQVAGGQLAQAGGQAAGNNSNVLLNSSQHIGQDYQNAAFQRASGYVGSANAWGDAFSGLGNNILSLGQFFQKKKGG